MRPTLFKITLLLFSTWFLTNNANSQSFYISGELANQNQQGIPTASVMLLNQKDSSFVKAVISDINGIFKLEDVKPGNYLLLIQHILYGKKCFKETITNANLDLGELTLNEQAQEISEVSVKAQRPVLKMTNNTLTYNAQAVSAKFVRSNALEVLGDVPGINLKDESVELIGASALSIAINGKPTTLNMEQVIDMLKAMPNTRVKEVQIMYAPPAKYNVKGALINIILTKSNENELNGSAYATYRQRKNASAEGGINLQLATKKLDIDFMYSGDYDNIITIDEMYTKHIYKDTIYNINQRYDSPDKSFEHSLQLSNTYKINDKQNLLLAYTGNYSNSSSDPLSELYYSSIKENITEFDTVNEKRFEYLHNLKFDYTLSDNLNFGVDYTNYSGPSTQDYNTNTEGVTSLFRTKSQQSVNKYMGYFNHSFTLKEIVDFNYGLNYTFTRNDNYYHYFDYMNGDYTLNTDQSSDNKFSESTSVAFAGFNKAFSSFFTVDFSLKGENDKMVKDTVEATKTLWNDFNLFPSLNITYIFDTLSNHILQFSLKSYSSYPKYWEISPTTWYINQYMLAKGNPELKPSQTYSANLNYIFKRKYVAAFSCEYTQNAISQIPYASEETFNTIAKTENLDYDCQLSAALVLPFNIGEHISVNPTYALIHRIMKLDNMGAQSFDRSGTFGIFQMNSALTISEKHGLKADLSGYYYTGMIQTIYDIDAFYDVSCGVSWDCFNDKGLLSLKLKDIFASDAPETHINFNNQQSTYKLDYDSRKLLVTFKYNFGKPIKTKKVDIDKSRFGRME